MEGGWIPSDGLLLELGLLFGLADFKHDSGIPGRQKNSGPSLGSQSKITHVFITGRQRRQSRTDWPASQKTGAAGALRGSA